MGDVKNHYNNDNCVNLKLISSSCLSAKNGDKKEDNTQLPKIYICMSVNIYKYIYKQAGADLYGPAPIYTVLYCNVLYSTVLYCTVLYCTPFRCNYNTIPYCTIQN